MRSGHSLPAVVGPLLLPLSTRPPRLQVSKSPTESSKVLLLCWLLLQRLVLATSLCPASLMLLPDMLSRCVIIQDFVSIGTMLMFAALVYIQTIGFAYHPRGRASRKQPHSQEHARKRRPPSQVPVGRPSLLCRASRRGYLPDQVQWCVYCTHWHGKNAG